jgi:hypothetical protein
MRCLLSALLTILLLSGFSGDKGATEVNGQVFIVTQGAGNIKLGLVTVTFLTEEQYKIASHDSSGTYQNAINYYNERDSVANNEKNMSLAEKYLNSAKMFEKIQEVMKKDQSKEIASNMEQYNYFKKKSTEYTRFTTDERAERKALTAWIEIRSGRFHDVVSDKTDADGRFKVILKNIKYRVFANATRKVSDSDEEYHWLFEYTPDGKPLYLSNDNMKQDRK